MNFNAFGWVACVAGGIRERGSATRVHDKSTRAGNPASYAGFWWALLTFHFEILEKINDLDNYAGFTKRLANDRDFVYMSSYVLKPLIARFLRFTGFKRVSNSLADAVTVTDFGKTLINTIFSLVQ